MFPLTFEISFLAEYRAVKPTTGRESWYHGTLNRSEAEKLLRDNGNVEGSYLVRYSGRNSGINVLSMVNAEQQCKNFQIKSNKVN